jgi:hypothetical protein
MVQVFHYLYCNATFICFYFFRKYKYFAPLCICEVIVEKPRFLHIQVVLFCINLSKLNKEIKTYNLVSKALRQPPWRRLKGE